MFKKIQHWAGVALIVAFLGHFGYFFFNSGPDSYQLTFDLNKVGGATFWQLLVLGCFLMEVFLVRGKGRKWLSQLLLNAVELVFVTMLCGDRFWRGFDILKWLHERGITGDIAGSITIGIAVVILLGNILWYARKPKQE